MKTTAFVMLFTLLGCFAAAAEGGVDQEIVVVGKDVTFLAIPQPWTPQLIDIPRPDTRRPPFHAIAPVLPPSGDWRPIIDQFPPRFLDIPLPIPFPP